ncbi:hypothetical protein [Maribacter polysaccharolyticus]|nr:hypothetical protein [Maribacter polysaccharolyticus]MDE3744081.1 hypothetical protein [Maribacter polysaccharolyticus]
MKAPRLILAMVALMAVSSFVSCEDNSITEEDQLYEQGIDTREVKNEDT